MIRRSGRVELPDPGSYWANRAERRYREQMEAKGDRLQEIQDEGSVLIVIAWCFALLGSVGVIIHYGPWAWCVVLPIIALLAWVTVLMGVGRKQTYDRHLRKGNILQIPEWIYDIWENALGDNRAEGLQRWGPYKLREFQLLQELLAVDAKLWLDLLAAHNNKTPGQELRPDQELRIKEQIGVLVRAKASILRGEYDDHCALESGRAELTGDAQATHQATVDLILEIGGSTDPPTDPQDD